MTAVRVGDRVVIERDEVNFPSKGTWGRFRGRVGTVVEVNLGEYGVSFSKVQPRTDGRGRFSWDAASVAWFRDYEIRRVGAAVLAGATQEPSPVSSIPEPPRRTCGPRPAQAIGTNCCDAWWTGLSAGHCSVCGHTFTSVSGFDKHRRGGRCLDPATVGLAPADKPWPGWSWPSGGWTGPMRPPPHGESV